MDLKKLAIAIGAISLTNISFAMADIKVVTSIKPVHSLVSGIMSGVGVPSLIIDGAGSPHTYSLKPSQAQQLQDAKLVFWMGDELETFLEGPIENIAQSAAVVKLIDAHGLKKIKFRKGGMFDDHEHEEHDEHGDHDGQDEHDHEKHAKKEHDDHGDHDGHDEHDHEKHAKKEHDDHGDHDGHDEHDHEKHAKKEHDDHGDHDGHDEHDHEKHAKKEHDDHGDHGDHDGHDDHGHGEFDPHVWLDPVNARAIVHEIEEALVKADPEHASTYEANAHRMMDKLDSLTAELREELEPVQEKGFIVFHDAYQYFEQRFEVTAIGSITVSPEVMPGAERVSELREKISELNTTCVFSEPQFEPKLVYTLIDGTGARTAVLDPLGASLTKGPDLYFQLLRNMASSFKKCLSGGS